MKIRTERLEENVFKFTIGSVEDKRNIVCSKPWAFNGAHLIYK